jgi:hypothetical protein
MLENNDVTRKQRTFPLLFYTIFAVGVKKPEKRAGGRLWASKPLILWGKENLDEQFDSSRRE